MTESAFAPPRPERRAARRAAFVLGLLLALAVSAVVAPALLMPALLVGVVLLPTRMAFGLVCRVLLVLRRRRAARVHRSAFDVRVTDAAVLATRLQRADRRFSIALLLLAVIGGGYDLVLTLISEAMSQAGFVSNNTSFLGDLMLALGALGAVPLLLALTAIPVAMVLVVLQIRDRRVLLGEALALERGGDAARRVRRSRLLGAAAFVLWEVIGVAALVAASGYLG